MKWKPIIVVTISAQLFIKISILSTLCVKIDLFYHAIVTMYVMCGKRRILFGEILKIRVSVIWQTQDFESTLI